MPESTDQSYNGWPTYETWAMNVWLSDVLYDIAEEYVKDNCTTASEIEDAPYHVAKRLEEWFDTEYLTEEHPYNKLNDVVKDLCRIDRVDWQALADSYVGDMDGLIADILDQPEDDVDPHWSHRDED